MIVHADARPGSQLSEERLGMGDLDCDLVATEASSEDALIANVRDADVVLVAGAQVRGEPKREATMAPGGTP